MLKKRNEFMTCI